VDVLLMMRVRTGLHMLKPVLVTATVVTVPAKELVLLLHGDIALIPTDMWGRCGRRLRHLLVGFLCEVYVPWGWRWTPRATLGPTGPG